MKKKLRCYLLGCDIYPPSFGTWCTRGHYRDSELPPEAIDALQRIIRNGQAAVHSLPTKKEDTP